MMMYLRFSIKGSKIEPTIVEGVYGFGDIIPNIQKLMETALYKNSFLDYDEDIAQIIFDVSPKYKLSIQCEDGSWFEMKNLTKKEIVDYTTNDVNQLGSMFNFYK